MPFDKGLHLPLSPLLSVNQLTRSIWDYKQPFSANSYVLDTNIVGKLKTGSVEHQLLAGVELFRYIGPSFKVTQYSIPSIDIFNPVYGRDTLDRVTGRFHIKSKFDNIGFYVQDQIELSNNLKLVLNGRLDFVDNITTNFITSTDTEQSDTAFSPRVGIVYQPVQSISLYTSYSRSFQQITGTDVQGNPFKPSRGTQYEVGVKTDWFDNKLSATLALYEITRTNLTTPDPENLNFSIQTGKQRSRGIELFVVGELAAGWNIIASYNYTDARIAEDNRFRVGNRLNAAPENTVSLWTTYTIPKGSVKGLGFGFGVVYVGEQQGDLANTFQLPSYLRADASVFYRRNNLRVDLNLKNLFDTLYYETANSITRVYPGEPFQALLNVGWEF